MKRNRAISQFMMYAALPLGLWFVVEYAVTVVGTRHLMLAALRTPMMLGTPIALCYLLIQIRKRFFPADEFSRFRCWYYGVQTMFFAGLIEAMAVICYNQWIAPDNLAEMRQAMIAQYGEVLQMYQQMSGGQQMLGGLMDNFEQAIEVLKTAEVETPFTAAITLLSNDIFYGILWSIPFSFALHRNPNNNNNA